MPLLCENDVQLVEYELRFDSVNIGTQVHEYRPGLTRNTNINERHNLWWTNMVLDGEYPAMVYSHSFQVYHTTPSVAAVPSVSPPMRGNELFYKWFLDFASVHTTHRPKTLELLDFGTANVRFDFGLCYLQQANPNTPEALLLFSAGVVELTFLGSTLPSHNDLPTPP